MPRPVIEKSNSKYPGLRIFPVKFRETEMTPIREVEIVFSRTLA